MSEKVFKKERSRAYPVMPLSEALARIKSIKDNLGVKGRYNRETIASGMGYSGLNGASARAVAALTQYGFLDREKDQYSLSDTAQDYLMPVEDDDQSTAMRMAALSPMLFAEIYQAFKGQVIPKQFINRLIQEFGIQEKAAPEVERIFKETMTTAGMLTDSNILSTNLLDLPERKAPREPLRNNTKSDQFDLTDDTLKTAPLGYLNVILPSGLIVSYEQNLASAFAFGQFGEGLKALDKSVTEYKKEHAKQIEERENA